MINKRIKHLIDTEGLTATAFADSIQVQRSGISHILSGRNKPSLDVIQKILGAYPLISAEWLILGQGDVYKRNLSNTLSSPKGIAPDVTNVTSVNNDVAAVETDQYTEETNLFSNKEELREEITSKEEKMIPPTLTPPTPPKLEEQENRNTTVSPIQVIVLYENGKFKLYDSE